jgi:peroxiredoxin
MATSSIMLPLGTQVPAFTLTDTVTGKPVDLQQFKSAPAIVIMFICNHCPYVKHVQYELVRLANHYQPQGIAFIAICSNDAKNYPEDSPEKMRLIAKQLAYPFPYLYDETQAVAKAYGAACTPDFYVFDKNLQCVYRGQLDDSRPGSDIPVTGKDLRLALDNILAGKPVAAEQKPSMGCSIKWK